MIDSVIHEKYIYIYIFFSLKNKMKGENTTPSYYVILENVFGLIGTILWSFQLAPQGKNY
jgi:hypothetical protein